MSPAPAAPDRLGRPLADLRISVTDRCNFRCTYCMPREAFGPDHPFLPRAEILDFEEITRLAGCFVGLGVRKLAQLRLPDGRTPDLSMTTNGSMLRNMAHELRDAGLQRVNVSLDTLQRERFLQMTRRDELDRVLDGIEAAKEAGFSPVKVNAVVERGVNDDEIVDLARYGREHDVEVRFIEFMPLDAGGHWHNGKVFGQDEIVAAISAVFPLQPVPARGAAPADRWSYLDGRGTVGVIPSVTKPFCGDCDRVRLTAEGQFRTCLFATHEFDLMTMLRDGADDLHLAAEIRRAVGTKWAGHQINQVTFVKPRRTMSQIGG